MPLPQRQANKESDWRNWVKVRAGVIHEEQTDWLQDLLSYVLQLTPQVIKEGECRKTFGIFFTLNGQKKEDKIVESLLTCLRLPASRVGM